jgi:hypothetical protein
MTRLRNTAFKLFVYTVLYMYNSGVALENILGYLKTSSGANLAYGLMTASVGGHNAR